MPQFGRRLSASSTPAARRSAIAATRRSSAICQQRRPAEYRDGAQDPPGAATAAPAEEDFKRPRAVSPSALPPGGPEVDDLVVAAAAAASKEPAAATVLAGPGGYLCSSPRLTMEKAAPAAREDDRQGVGSRGYVRARALCFQAEERKEREVEDQITGQQQRYENNKRFFGCSLRTAHCDGQQQQQQQQQQQIKGGAALLLRNNSSVSSTMSEPVDIPGARSTSSSVESGGGAGADEEGWVSLWNTYTRLFPGTFTGCSPPGPAPPLDSPLYAASPRPPPPPPLMDASLSSRNKAPSMAGTPDVRGGGLLPAARASGRYPLPPVMPESCSGSRLPTTATVRRRRRLNQRRPSTAAVPTSPSGGCGCGGDASRPGGNDAATGGDCAKTDPGPSHPASSTPRPDGRSSCHRYQQPGEEEVVGHGDEMLLDDDDDDDDEVPPRGYSWEQLSRMPLEEAGRKLGTFSAKGFSTGGGGGGGGDGRGCLDVSDCEEGGGGCAAGSFEDDLDDNSDADLELSEGLMFDLEM
ncbi:unnamed protein product [Ectocarpus sp. 4 AP-2014]